MKSLKDLQPVNWPIKLNKVQYVAEINRKNPTAFLFLIDQSQSMIKEKQIYRGKEMTYAHIVAEMINELLNELISRCQKSEGLRDYFDICVIGYGGQSSEKANILWEDEMEGKDWVRISDLKMNARYETKTIVKTIRGISKTTQAEVPYWFSAKGNYKTPMGDALNQAQSLLKNWILQKEHQNSYPPVVINITDGMQTDCSDDELVENANELQALYTSDGHVILINCHINKDSESVVFPISENELPENPYSKLLYEMSSIMPASYGIDIANLRKDADVYSNYRGLAFNMNVDSLFNMIDIGTSGGTKQINQ